MDPLRTSIITSAHQPALFYVQGEAIAYNLREMFGLRVPVISVVIGEGGSGGALAIGCANKNLIMENAVYYVASPEACAAILWKSRSASNQVRWPQQLCMFWIGRACVQL
jgi:acetyl-CoA carboxylase alpha subunit